MAENLPKSRSGCGCFGCLGSLFSLFLTIFTFQIVGGCAKVLLNMVEFPADEILPVAQDAVQKFHALQRQEKCDEIVDNLLVEELQVQRLDAVKWCETVINKYGIVESTTFKDNDVQYGSNGITVELQNDTVFSKASYLERFVWRFEDGQAKLLRYEVINPTQSPVPPNSPSPSSTDQQ